MTLLYLVSQRLPTEKAYGRQIAKMCSKFADLSGVDLELIYPTRHNLIKESFFEYYDIKDNFRISRISAPDFNAPGFLEVLAFGVKNIISALILARAVLTRHPDVVYSREELPLYILSFFRKNLVFESHKMQIPRKFMYRRFKNNGVKIVAIVQALKDDFLKIGFEVKNILVAPDGVDFEIVNKEGTSPSDKGTARILLGLPSGQKLAVYTGSLYRWKGVYVLADAAKLMPGVLFFVVGGDERGDEAEFKRYLVEQRINNVKVTGYIKSEETVRSYLAAADVLILPNSAKDKVSQKYTSPLKLFAYMASRRPIVASDLPSLREILNENNSILVKPDDALALAEGIKKVLNDPVSASHMSNLAFEDAKQYTWEKRAESIINFMNK